MNTEQYYKNVLGSHMPAKFAEPTGPDMCDPTPYPTLQEIVARSNAGERIAGLPGFYDEGVPEEAIPRNIDLDDIHQAQMIINDAQNQPKREVKPPVKEPAPDPSPDPAPDPNPA